MVLIRICTYIAKYGLVHSKHFKATEAQIKSKKYGTGTCTELHAAPVQIYIGNEGLSVSHLTILLKLVQST